jgi:hypothetical protein
MMTAFFMPGRWVVEVIARNRSMSFLWDGQGSPLARPISPETVWATTTENLALGAVFVNTVYGMCGPWGPWTRSAAMLQNQIKTTSLAVPLGKNPERGLRKFHSIRKRGGGERGMEHTNKTQWVLVKYKEGV